MTKIVLDSAPPFQRVPFPPVFMCPFGEFSHLIFCPFLSSKNTRLLDWACLDETGLWWWSARPCSYHMLQVIALNISPWLLLLVSSGLTVWETNLLAHAQKRHWKDPAQALSMVKKCLPNRQVQRDRSQWGSENQAENPTGLPCCFQRQHFGFNAYLAGKIMHRENVRMHICPRD